MKNQSSFILNPLSWDQSHRAKLHLVVVDDSGTRLGVLATVHDPIIGNSQERCLSCEKMGELQKFEHAAVIEFIRKEVVAGNIDKAFAFDMAIAVKGYPWLLEASDLFRFDPYDSGSGGDGFVERMCIERDRIQKLIDAVREEYLAVE